MNTTPASSAELGGARDLWTTARVDDIVLLFFTFAIGAAVDLFITAFLLLRSSATGDGAYLSPMLSWVPPIILWAATTLCFLYFVKVARYGPGWGEWAGAGFTSSAILGFTFYFIAVPCETEKVVMRLAGPGARPRNANNGN